MEIARGTLLRAASAVAVLVVVGVVLYRSAVVIFGARREAQRSAETAIERPRAFASERTEGAPSAPRDPEAVRASAQAALRQCLARAELAFHNSWNGMCAVRAQQQGHAAVQDCLLPHATASSIAAAESAAKGDCYEQFQAAMQER